MKIFALHPHRRAGRFVEWKGLARHLRAELGEDMYGCRTSFHDDLFDPLAEHLRKGIGDQAGSDMLSSIGWFKSEAPRMPAVVLFEKRDRPDEFTRVFSAKPVRILRKRQIVHVRRDILFPGEGSDHKIHDAVHFFIRRMPVDNHDFSPL